MMNKSWKSFLKDYLNFSRAERLGIAMLCGLVLITLSVKWIGLRRTKSEIYDTTAFTEEILLFRNSINMAATATNDLTETSIHEQTYVELFYFDPNRATNADWEKLGLNERQIRNIRNFLAAGGNFRRKEDLQRMYTISAPQYRQLEPYIRIGGNEQRTPQITSFSVAEEEEMETVAEISENETILQIELNLADSSLLTSLHGIGPVLASRTIRYRNLIGGFNDVAQLGEVFGIDAELVKRLSPQLSADSSLIRKISVNTASLNVLTNHPYINEQQARGIMNYRRLQNRINNIDELVRNNIIERETAERIRPYLSFE